jgi:hypothetical protein
MAMPAIVPDPTIRVTRSELAIRSSLETCLRVPEQPVGCASDEGGSGLITARQRCPHLVNATHRDNLNAGGSLISGSAAPYPTVRHPFNVEPAEASIDECNYASTRSYSGAPRPRLAVDELARRRRSCANALGLIAPARGRRIMQYYRVQQRDLRGDEGNQSPSH